MLANCFDDVKDDFSLSEIDHASLNNQSLWFDAKMTPSGDTTAQGK